MINHNSKSDTNYQKTPSPQFVSEFKAGFTVKKLQYAIVKYFESAKIDKLINVSIFIIVIMKFLSIKKKQSNKVSIFVFY